MKRKELSIIIASTLVANMTLNALPSNIKVVSATELSGVSTDSEDNTISVESVAEETGNSVSAEQMQMDFQSMMESQNENDSVSLSSDEDGVEDSIYLSDLNYNESLSELEWGKVYVNRSSSGENINLLVDGESKIFTKGLGVDTNGKIVYEIESYSNTYTKLVGYLGVDYRQKGNGDGVQFSIEVSNDGVNWTTARDIGVKTADQESYKVSVNVSGVKYIRLSALAGPKGNKSYDHAAFADFKLVNDDYSFETENENSVSFSFSGDDANTLVVDSPKDISQISYSLNGGSDWINPSNFETSEFGYKLIKLSEDELKSINANDDIKVRIGSYEYVIDVTSANAPSSSTVYGNDLEDRLIGSIDNLEYRVGNEDWQDYDSKVTFTGDQTVEVRYKANGTSMPSPSAQYIFTKSKDTPERAYVPLSEVSLYKFCSEQNNGYSYAKNMLDGDANTLWHNNWNGENDLYYSVQFNEVKFISSIEYLPNTGENGRLRSGEILVSLDGENWESAGTFKDLDNNSDLKTINISTPMPARYLKIQATQTWGSTQNIFFTGRMLNFYEDTTKDANTEPFVKYSTLEPTNNYVLATLVLTEGYTATIKTHKFTSNGEYEFEYQDSEGKVKTVKAVVNNIVRDESADSVYLSDLEYETSMSNLGWNGVRNDVDPAGESIDLIVNGYETTFKKGIGAHAGSEVVYDIEAFSDKYTRFSAYLGVDSGRKNNGSVRFTILASKDGVKWDELKTTEILSGNSESVYVDLDVKDYVYLKLKADSCGNSSEDYSVYADARLVKTDYDVAGEVYTGFKTLAEYDSEISSRTVQENFENHKRQILEREFVNRIGYGNIISASRDVEGVYEALKWIQTDSQALELFIEAGDFFSGTGYNALVALGKLYNECSADLFNLQYKKMLIATAVAYSKDFIPFQNNYGGNYVEANPVASYKNFKKLYDDGKFIRKEEFENYHMELVRAVMDSRINYDEIIWLRDYIDKIYPDESSWQRYNGYGFANYAYGDFNAPKYYDESNKDMWDKKYGFLDYGISYGEPSLYRIWMVMDAGAICWGLTGLGMNLNEVQGIPAIGTFQPGHEAYMLYSVDKDGNGIWSMSDDISGWESSFSRWYNMTKIEHRLLLSWGQKEYNVLNNSGTGNNTSYMMLAQDALNHYDKGYSDSMLYNLIANSYDAGSDKHLEALNKSLECYDKNLDAIYELYKVYLVDPNMTDDGWVEFAEMISEKYRYFPVPMTDLLALIKEQVKTDIAKMGIEIMETESLKAASVATSAESLQSGVCVKVANSLLGKVNTELATFSFDGENANTIMINDTYAESTIQVRVSLDGGKTWEKFENGSDITTEHAIKLTDEQLAKITAENDILVGLMGTPNNFTIDIKEGATITNSLLYKNDLENKLIGDLYGLQYSEDGGSTWSDFTNDTRFPSTEDRVVLVRYRAKGQYLASKSVQYTFKADRDTDTRKYITIDHLSLHSFSTEVSSDKAANIIDGNGNTGWHANGSQEETLSDPRYVVIKLDEVKYISAIEYFSSYNNGKVKAATVYTSLDGVNWVEAGKSDNWANNSDTKSLDLKESSPARYIKFVGTETYGSPIISCKILDLFEDTTKTYKADANIEYEEVNDTVVAKLVLPNGCKVIGESEHVFTSNGTFEFKFTDANDKEQTITATVDRFDESLPTMEYEFDNPTSTNKDVTLKITSFSKENTKVVSIDENPSFDEEGNYIVKEEESNETSEDLENEGVSASTVNDPVNTYVFSENKTVVFILEDKDGRRNYIPVTVDWIDKEAPKVSIEYSTQDPTYDSVTATLVGVKEGETVTSDGGNTHVFDKNGEFEFVVEDKAGNITKVTASVDWIRENGSDKDENLDEGFNVEDSRDFDVEFNYDSLTNKDVIATLVGLDSTDEVISEGGKSHTFTTNGKFTFKIKDVNGNIFEKSVEVDWIDKEAPTASIVFDYSKADEGKVIARLSDPSEEIKITNADGLDYHEFTSNDTYIFEFIDGAGNVGKAEAKVDWFKFEDISNFVSYKNIFEGNKDETDSTPSHVIATVSIDPDKIEILNNEGSNEIKFVKNGVFALRARMIDSDYEFYIMVEVDCLEETAEEGESPIELPSQNEGASTDTDDSTNEEGNPSDDENGTNTDDSTNDGNLGGDIEDGSDNVTVAPPITTPPVTNPDNGNIGNDGNTGSEGNSGNGNSGNGDVEDNTGNSLENSSVDDSNTGSIDNSSNGDGDYSNNNYLGASVSYSESLDDSNSNKESSITPSDEEYNKEAEINSSNDSTNSENSSKDSVKEDNSQEDKVNNGVIATVIALTTASASVLFIWLRRLFGIKK